MNPEERELLKRTLILAEENNKMIRSLHRSMRWAQFWGFIKIVLVVSPLIFGYIYLKPYLGSLSDEIRNAGENLKKAGQLIDSIR